MTSNKQKDDFPRKHGEGTASSKKPYFPPRFQQLDHAAARAKLEAETARGNLGAEEMLRRLDQPDKSRRKLPQMGRGEMESLLLRLQALVQELLELNSELERDVAGHAGTEVRSELAAHPTVLRAVKGVVDYSRHLLWPYILAAEKHRGGDVRDVMQQLRMERTRQMLVAIRRGPASESTRQFLEEVRRMTNGED